MRFEIASPGKSIFYKFVDAPWKTAVTCTVISLIITIVLVRFFNGFVQLYVPFIVVLCAFPTAYGSSALIMRYQHIIDAQNNTLVALTNELTDANDQLHIRNNTLNDLTQSLEASNAELNAYAGTVAHDLKNPLSSIVNYLEISEYYLALNDIEPAQEKIEQAQKLTLESAHTIDSLLLLASIRQEERIYTETIEMGQIVAQVQERLNFMISEYNAQIQLPREWSIARGYAPWITEVWINYLSNALKYGGKPPTIVLGSDRQDQGIVRFWVRDNGLGLTQTEQSLLFHEFTRLQHNRADGHGLGLSIAKRIVEKLGGQVGVESQKGQGSLFYFTLPET